MRYAQIKKNITIVVLIISLGSISIVNYSQSLSDFIFYKNFYPDQTSIEINDFENVQIDVKNNRYIVTTDISKTSLLLQNPTSQTIRSQIFYDSEFQKITDLSAYTLVPYEKGFKKVVAKVILDESAYDNILFDHLRVKNITFSALQPGVYTVLKYKSTTDYPILFSSTFFFKGPEPKLFSKLTIKMDKGVRLRSRLFNPDSTRIDFRYSEKENSKIYTWTSEKCNGILFENESPNYRYYVPHVVYYIDNPNPKDTTSVQNVGLNGLYNSTVGFIKNINQKNDKDILNKVQGITSGATTEEEKIKRIYYWVQQNIKGIAIYDKSIMGYIPEEASIVYSKRYGDCKGMSSLLNYMLQLEGIKSYFTLIGTRDIPYKCSEMPTYACFNHMIVTYYKDGTPVFLDATNKYLPFGMPSSMIQGKQALVELNDKTYKVENISIVESSKNFVIDSTYLIIKDNKIFGKGEKSCGGYSKSLYTKLLIENDGKKRENNINELIKKGNNKCYIDSFRTFNLDSIDLPLRISYCFTIEDYFRKVGDQIFINMSLDKPYYRNVYNLSKRSSPVDKFYKRKLVYTTVLKIPDGYFVSHLPSNRMQEGNLLSSMVSYSTDANTIVQRREIELKSILIDISNLDQWNKEVDAHDQSFNDLVTLMKLKQAITKP